MAVMDRQTAEHFYAWMEKWIPFDEQHEMEQAIHQLLRENPELIEQNRSWPEMARMVGLWN